jgi:hypothetical protein
MLTLKQRQERAARRAARIAAKHDAIRQAAPNHGEAQSEGSTVMKKHEVKVGAKYLAKVSDKVVPVRIDGENPHGGWDATNGATGKKVHIKSAQRLRGEAKPKAAAKEAAPAADVGPTAKPDAKVVPEAKGKKPRATKPKGERKPGILTLAADVLKDAKAPMDCKAIVEKVLAKGLWQTKGKTPAGTLYAAVIREIAAKGPKARFHKTDRGLFELGAAARR